MTPIMGRNVYVGVGSNIEPLAHIGAALDSLRRLGLLRAISPCYRTRAVGIPGASDFLNLALRLSWSEDLTALKAQLDELETDAGRRPVDGGWSPRPLDLDILLDGATIASYGSRPWRVPHPDIERFAHVAVPLADIAGHLPHPGVGRPIAEIAAALGRDGLETCAWQVSLNGS